MKKTLRFWILSLTIFMIAGMLCSTLFSAYLVTRQNVIDHSMEINRVYSEKLAQITDEVFTSMKQSLETRQQDMAKDFFHPAEVLERKLEQLLYSSQNFNAVSIIDHHGVIVSAYPNTELKGQRLTSIGAKESLEQKRTLISSPYESSATGRLIISVSTPLWGEGDEYLGYLTGTIYLQERNIIRTILGDHFAMDGSYVYVVDGSGTLVYHPELVRIGETVETNEVVRRLMDGHSGSQLVTNTRGIEMLAGYTYTPSSQWGIVSQTPYETAIAPVYTLIRTMTVYSIPFVAVFLILAYVVADRLASPLRKLALFALNYSAENKVQEKPAISTWFFEAEQLNKTLEDFTRLQETNLNNYKAKSLTDPLTGLANRRQLEETLGRWQKEKEHFSMLVLDIDFFKKVNDEFGHQTGDEVLIYLANTMKQFTRNGDLCARFGGEEFVIVLPDTQEYEALHLAESLREHVSGTLSPTGRPITISLGVGAYREGEELGALFNRVDHALYQAKREGRNRSVVSQPA